MPIDSTEFLNKRTEHVSNVDTFTVKMFMIQHQKELKIRGIAESTRYIKQALGIKVHPTTLKRWGDLLNIKFNRKLKKQPTKTQKEISKLHTQIKTLAVAIREIYEDAGMLHHPAITEIIKQYAKNNIKN
jgi:hypothetical protein